MEQSKNSMLTYNQMLETGKPFKNTDSPETKVWVEFDGEFISGQELSPDEIKRLERQKTIDDAFEELRMRFNFDSCIFIGINNLSNNEAQVGSFIHGNVRDVASSLLGVCEKVPELAVAMATEIGMSSEGILNENLN